MWTPPPPSSPDPICRHPCTTLAATTSDYSPPSSMDSTVAQSQSQQSKDAAAMEVVFMKR
jgi:hypothetical protein